MRQLRLLLLAVPLLVTLGAAPAQAQWVGLKDLHDPGASWVREYTTAPPLTIYASTEDDGVWRSLDNGVNWASFNSGLDTVPGAMHVRTVYTSGTTAYAGTTAGLFKSVAGGSWNPVAQGAEVDPKQPKKLNKPVQTLYSPLIGKLLAGVASGGVYSSGDDGATWQPPAPGNGMSSSETVWSIGTLVPGVLFAATGSGVYRSVNNGSTWTLASDGISGTILRVFADEKAPNIIYASGTDGVFRTINGGLTWSDAGGPPGHQLPGGAVRALQQFSGINETRLYAGTPQGVYAGTTGHGVLPGPIRWQQVANDGLSGNTIIWALKSFTTTPGILWAGTQSNGGYALPFTPPVNTAKPIVAGTAQAAKTVTTTDGVWIGTKKIEFEYQWQRCTNVATPVCSDIPDATSSSYVVAAGDQGFHLRSVVTGSNNVPTFGLFTGTSDPTAVVIAAAGTIAGSTLHPSPSVTVSGQPQPGKLVTALNPAFLPAAATFVFRWYRCDENGINCEPIPGGIGQSYLLTNEAVGSKLCATATGTAAGANPGSSTSDCGTRTNIVLAPDPVQTGATTMSGNAYVGDTLVSGVGTWECPGTTFTRQWESCNAAGGSCSTISGAKSATYVVKADDLGDRLRVRISIDSNGPNNLPAAVEKFTPLSPVVTDPPPPPADPVPQGNDIPGGNPAPTPPAPGGGGSPGPAPDKTAPVLQSLGAVSTKLKPGTALRLKVGLSEGGSLSVELQRVRAGRKQGKTCKAGAKKGKKCTAISKVATVNLGVGGSGIVALPKRKLAAGDYRAVVTPIDAAGNRGAARTVAFKVKTK
jgi:hypothetical protein